MEYGSLVSNERSTGVLPAPRASARSLPGPPKVGALSPRVGLLVRASGRRRSSSLEAGAQPGARVAPSRNNFSSFVTPTRLA